jgi:hypothetical protein
VAQTVLFSPDRSYRANRKSNSGTTTLYSNCTTKDSVSLPHWVLSGQSLPST